MINFFRKKDGCNDVLLLGVSDVLLLINFFRKKDGCNDVLLLGVSGKQKKFFQKI